MALVIVAHNTGKGSAAVASYHVTVAMNRKVIAKGVVTGHKRADGWQALCKKIASSPEIVTQTSSDPDWLAQQLEHYFLGREPVRGKKRE